MGKLKVSKRQKDRLLEKIVDKHIQELTEFETSNHLNRTMMMQKLILSVGKTFLIAHL